MDRIESLGPYDHLTMAYRTFCEEKIALVKKCIDLVVNTELSSEPCIGLDNRVPEE